MTAQQLLDFLLYQQRQGQDLSCIKVNFRKHYDSNVVRIVEVEEDLYYPKSDNLMSIMLVADTSER